jgi:TPR repeat protein
MDALESRRRGISMRYCLQLKRTSAALSLALIVMTWSSHGNAGLREGLDALRKGDYAAAAKELRPVAERGDPEAQYRIGLMYEYGKGYPKDMAQAVAWLRKSAAQNHAAAQTELGILYATGDGVPADAAQAVEWFRKAAPQGNVAAQYNLGLLIAKGEGAKKDDAQAVAWFRKAADQGMPEAQFKMGVAYENGEGVAKDPVLAYASYAIAARNGNKESVVHRDDIARTLTQVQLRDGQALAAAWEPGKPMPTVVAAAGRPAAPAAAASGPDKCAATGQMEGERFIANHCAVALYGDAHSVAIWFNEDAITPAEVDEFRLSSHAGETKGGKPRTKLIAMFCPGGGSAAASPAAVKSIDLNTNHAKSPLAGIQWVVESPKDFKVEKMAGDVKPGGRLSGRIVGSRAKTSWNLDFDVTLPAKDAAAGLSCKQ